MAALMRTDSENPAVTAQKEKGEQGPIVWDISARTAEDPTDFEFDEKASSWTVTVEEGDTLTDLALEVYGQGDQTTLDMLMEKNPAIDDVDVIIVGQRIAFPPLSEMVKKSDSLE